MDDQYAATPEDRFSFGLWTVGHRGGDPFGLPTRPPIDPLEIVARLGRVGAWGVSFHDDDLVPFGTALAERDRIVARFGDAVREAGMVVSMATANLFTQPVFRDGALTAGDPAVRRFALRKLTAAIDTGAELGAGIFVMWGGREGVDSAAARDPRVALERYREGVNFVCEYIRAHVPGMRLALEAKPNEPRGHIYLPTTGHMLHFIETLEHPEMVGVNPEMAHESMAGLSFSAAVGQALWAGKLWHIDLNSQNGPRYDQDYRFGAEDLKEAFLTVRLLERSGYDGPRHSTLAPTGPRTTATSTRRSRAAASATTRSSPRRPRRSTPTSGSARPAGERGSGSSRSRRPPTRRTRSPRSGPRTSAA